MPPTNAPVDRIEPKLSYAGVDRRRRSTHLAVVIVDAAAQVRFSFWEGPSGDRARFILNDDRTCLLPSMQAVVAQLAVEAAGHAPRTHVVRLDDEHSLRVSPLIGHAEILFALIVEADRHADGILRAARRFQLTRRQSEVLSLVLEGATAGEIAQRLSISEYTAQGYIKSLLSKTGSRNRSAMVAKVLEWKQSAAAPAVVELDAVSAVGR